ncbi:hypothetical protein PX554_20310 [Sphingomonas sp. H39-1-10]|uniref:hypothetical protein n=1 Tax=Sphingomonas pollutisoli TaxID=3030829 RepID=UPI0023B9F399|nr:hypothetical protein [Sphingomonas pollutisoli]MDF0490478.1 hypothetical protein [Sphingomonas pollutisoli]
MRRLQGKQALERGVHNPTARHEESDGNGAAPGSFLISLTDVARIVMWVGDIDEDAERTVLQRLLYFSRLDFPLARARAYAPRYLTVAALLKILVAFELQQAGMPPIRVVRLVETDWEAMRHAFAAAGSASGASAAPVLMLAPVALAEIAVIKSTVEEPLSETLGYTADAAVLADAARKHARLVVIDSYRLVERLRAALRRLGGLVGRDADNLIREFCQSA